MRKMFTTMGLMWLILAGASAQAYDPLALSDVSQSVKVTVVVNKKARVEVPENIGSVTVISADSARGYVDIGAGFRLKVWCNSPDGVSVSARTSGGISDPSGRYLNSQRLSIQTAAGRYQPLNEQGVEIYSSSVKEIATPIDCRLRLHLPPGSPTGRYRFDLQLEAVPK